MDLDVSVTGAPGHVGHLAMPGQAALFVDPDTDRVIDVSEEMLGLLGREREAVIGSSPTRLGLWEEPLAGLLVTEVVPHGDKRVLVVRLAGEANGAAEHPQHPPTVPYRAMVEQLPAILYTEIPNEGSPTGTSVSYLSPAVESILGYSAAELLAERGLWDRITHPEDLDLVNRLDREVSETGAPFLAEYRMFDRSGRIHWFRDRATLVRDELTGICFWQGVMIEITEERVAQEQLRAAEERYRSLVETVPAIVYVDRMDDNATNVYTSPQTEAVLGYSVTEWVSNPHLWPGMIHPDDRERVFEANRVHEWGEVFDEVYRVVAKDGRVVWVRDVASTIRGADGQEYAHGILLDVSSQKQAEEALRAALEREQEATERLREMDRLKQTILHTLSHDLKSPLAAILGAASTVVTHGTALGPEVRDELLEGVVERARRMDRLLTDILDLERLDRGLVEPDREPADIGSLCRRVVAECEAVSGRRVDVLADAVAGEVDVAKVERIVENLLVNAARHTPDGTRIYVRADMSEDGVALAVEDEGPGVPDEIKTAIFEVFRRGEQSGSRSVSGSGIGLSLVARYARIHGGRTWVEDRAGGGASFRVLLPNSSAP